MNRTSPSGAGAVLYAKDKDLVAAFYGALGLAEVDRDDEHVRLESATFQLVVLRMPEHIASTIQISDPPARRSNAAVKLVVFVANIANARTAAVALGGVVNDAAKEWSFDGCTVCDALDPEGNVIQLRERTT